MTNLWIIYAFIACFLSSFKLIIFNYINKLNNEKIDIILLISIIYILTGIISFFYIITNYKINTIFYTINKIKNNINNNNNNNNNNKINILVLSLLPFIIYFTTIIAFYSLLYSPNMSYTRIIMNFNIIISILASIYIFNQHIKRETIIGIIISMIGLFTVIYYSKN